MHDLPAKNQWTGTRTITAAGNRTCIITLRLSDFKSQTSLTLLLRHYELTNENVSYFLTNQSKTKTFIDLKVTRKPKPTKNSTWAYLYEILLYFIHKIKTKGFEVIRVNVFPRKKEAKTSLVYYYGPNYLPCVNFLRSYLVQIATKRRMTCKSIAAYSEYLSIFYRILLCLDLKKESTFDTNGCGVFV